MDKPFCCTLLTFLYPKYYNLTKFFFRGILKLLHTPYCNSKEVKIIWNH